MIFNKASLHRICARSVAGVRLFAALACACGALKH
jgi:hypothetical protein